MSKTWKIKMPRDYAGGDQLTAVKIFAGVRRGGIKWDSLPLDAKQAVAPYYERRFGPGSVRTDLEPDFEYAKE